MGDCRTELLLPSLTQPPPTMILSGSAEPEVNCDEEKIIINRVASKALHNLAGFGGVVLSNNNTKRCV